MLQEMKEGTRPRVPWETRFNEIISYKAKHGDCNVILRQGPLGRWVHEQRKSYKKNKLAQDRIDRLNGIGFDWMPSIGWKRKDRPSRGAPKVEALSIGAGAKGDGLNRFEGEDFGTGPELSLPGPSIKSDNLGTKSDDEDDEIGALIYDQVMRKKTYPSEMAD